VTLFVGQYDPERRLLTYSNAGHNPPLLYHRNGRDSLAWLTPTGAAVGIMENYSLHAEQVLLQPDDLLLLYTDGVTEMSNPQREYFGTERLAELLSRNSQLSAPELVTALRAGLDKFGAGGAQADDITMVAIRGLP